MCVRKWGIDAVFWTIPCRFFAGDAAAHLFDLLRAGMIGVPGTQSFLFLSNSQNKSD